MISFLTSRFNICASVYHADFSVNNTISIPGLYQGSTAFGDYDNDGDLDILMTGNTGSTKTTRVYENTGKNFIENKTITLEHLFKSASVFGDYDNDGDLDILHTRQDGSYIMFTQTFIVIIV
jgi:hypothetical protein